MKPKYKAVAGSQLRNADAQMVGEELARIESTKGSLRPEVIVDEARPSRARLHPFLEWRDNVAGEQWRRFQATNLVRAVVVVRDDNPEASPPAFVSVRRKGEPGDKRRNKGREFVSVERALSDADWRDEVLQRMWDEVDSLIRRYGHLREFCEIVNIKKARRRKVAA